MQLKMYQVLAYRGLYSKLQTKQVPLKLAYKFNKLFLDCEKDATFYQTELAKILEKYAEVDEKGQMIYNTDSSIKVKDGLLGECQKAVTDLQELDISLMAPTFKLDELEGIDIEVGDLQALMPFIEE